MKLDFIDVRRAYFHADAIRDIYIELPPEFAEEGMCGKLMKSMYGTRDAASRKTTGLAHSSSFFMPRVAIPGWSALAVTRRHRLSSVVTAYVLAFPTPFAVAAS